MTSLNNRLQLALLNRKGGKSALEKGFTLVELMIVIVIVGVLSAVALPSFLGQQNKAKITEASTKLSAILKSAHAEYTYEGSDADAITQAITESSTASTTGRFTFSPVKVDASALASTDTLTPANILIVGATPTAASSGGDAALATAAGGGYIFACINLSNGKVDLGREFKTTVTTAVDGSGGSSAIEDLDCA